MRTNVEDKITYEDPQQGIKVVRGIIIKEDNDFFYIQRRDGMVQIARRAVLSIRRRSKLPVGGDHE